MSGNSQYTIASKKKTEVKPYLEIFQAKRKGDANNNYLAQIYNTSKFQDESLKQAFEFNQCIFSDNFQNSASNILKIKKIQQTNNFIVHYCQKYDKSIQQYIQGKKKGRIPEEKCLKIMQDILKGLYTILQGGYRPVAIRSDSVVRIFSKNPQQMQQKWKIKNVVYQSSINMEHQSFLTYEEAYSSPEIYSRKNVKGLIYQESQQYSNSLLVWSLGIIFAKLLGIEGKLDSKKKLSEFRDREFNIMDILYIRNEYSTQFLKVIASMLHFDNKKRLKLKDLFSLPIFSQNLTKKVRKPAVIQAVQKIWDFNCNLFQLSKV